MNQRDRNVSGDESPFAAAGAWLLRFVLSRIKIIVGLYDGFEYTSLPPQLARTTVFAARQLAADAPG